MAGTLTISTLSDGTNSTSSTNCIQGSAKAWVTYKGTSTQSIRASYNVSSVTYNATGNYNINFTNALIDANYCMVAGVLNVTTNNTTLCCNSLPSSGTTLNVLVASNSNATVDSGYVCVSIFR